MKRSKSWLLLAVLSSYPACAATYTADVQVGADTNPGSSAQPFKTLAKCVEALKQPGDVCELRAGTYEAGGVLSASGTAMTPIFVQARSGESVTIRQGLQPAWINSGNNIWSTAFNYKALLNAQDANKLYFERGIRLWQDSKPLTEACFPNLPAGANGMHPTILAEQGSSPSLLKNSRLPTGDLRGARAFTYPGFRQYVECRAVLSSGVGQINVASGFNNVQVGNPFYLEGAKALIDQEWEWAWDEGTGRIWIQMPNTVNPNSTPVRIQWSSTAFQVLGSYVSIRGLRFQGVVPVASETSYGIRYDSLVINEPGILSYSDPQTVDYDQLAGLVVRNGAVVTHTTIDGCNGRCLDVAGSDVLIEDNIIRNGTRLGQFEGAISVLGRSTRIQRNLIENSGRDGIGFMARGVDGSIVRRNKIVNCGLQAWDAAGITTGSHPNGPLTIDSNLILNVNKEGAGIFFDESSQRNFVDHNIIGGVSVGILAQAWYNAGVSTFQNNAIWHNTILPGAGASFAMRDIRNLNGSRFSNNIVSVAPTKQSQVLSFPFYFASQVSNSAEYSSWGATWTGTLREIFDPEIKDIANQDFSLRPTSPAIDIGNVASWPYKGALPDAGAIESGTNQWSFGPFVPSSPTLGFEDASLWNPPSWDLGSFSKGLSSDKVEGNSSLAVIANGYKVLESAPLAQNEVGGLGAVKWSMKISTLQPNPYWVGSVQVMLSCPSRNLYNAWVGQVDLVGLAQGQWLELTKPLPANVTSALTGASYSDLRVSLTMNTNQGAGPLQFDDFHFIP